MTAGVDGHEASAVGRIFRNTRLIANGDLETYSGRDTLLSGANIHGHNVTMDVGRDLHVISLASASSVESTQFGANLTVGLDGSFRGFEVAAGNLSGDFSSTDTPSTITSGHDSDGDGVIDGGALNIDVGRNTYLVGALIDSRATDALTDEADLLLTLNTGGLFASDVTDNFEYSATAFGLSVTAGEDTLSGSVSFAEESFDETTVTRATIGEGRITIRNAGEVASTFANLSRDVDLFPTETVENLLLVNQIAVEEADEQIDLAQVPNGVVTNFDYHATTAYQDLIASGASIGLINSSIESGEFQKNINRANLLIYFSLLPAGDFSNSPSAKEAFVNGTSSLLFFEDGIATILLSDDCDGPCEDGGLILARSETGLQTNFEGARRRGWGLALLNLLPTQEGLERFWDAFLTKRENSNRRQELLSIIQSSRPEAEREAAQLEYDELKEEWSDIVKDDVRRINEIPTQISLLFDHIDSLKADIDRERQELIDALQAGNESAAELDARRSRLASLLEQQGQLEGAIAVAAVGGLTVVISGGRAILRGPNVEIPLRKAKPLRDWESDPQTGVDGEAGVSRGSVTFEATATPHETKVAQELADQGQDVIVRGENIPGPDARINGLWYDIKRLGGSGKRSLQSAINEAKNNFTDSGVEDNGPASLGLTRSDTRALIDARGNDRWDDPEAVIAELNRMNDRNDLKKIAEVRVITNFGVVTWRRT